MRFQFLNIFIFVMLPEIYKMCLPHTVLGKNKWNNTWNVHSMLLLHIAIIIAEDNLWSPTTFGFLLLETQEYDIALKWNYF
jgi:hypothetical protein